MALTMTVWWLSFPIKCCSHNIHVAEKWMKMAINTKRPNQEVAPYRK